MPHRVLVVEDDPTLRLVIHDNLGSEGYDVDVAADGACAIRQTRAATPDLIVLDLTLPDCDGLDLLPILRLGGQIPIIILTARTQQVEKLSGLRLGADDYITKPLIWTNCWRAFVRCFGAHGPASNVYAWGR